MTNDQLLAMSGKYVKVQFFLGGIAYGKLSWSTRYDRWLVESSNNNKPAFMAMEVGLCAPYSPVEVEIFEESYP